MIRDPQIANGTKGFNGAAAGQVVYKNSANVATGNANVTVSDTGTLSLGSVPFFVNDYTAYDGYALKYSSSLGMVAFEPDPQNVLPRIPGRIYGPALPGGNFNTLNNFTLNTNTVSLVPFFSPRKTTYSKMGFKTGASFSGTGTYRCGLYSNVNGMPSARLYDWGTVTASAANTVQEVFASGSLSGWYWLAITTVTAATNNLVYTVQPPGNGFYSLLGGATTDMFTSANHVGFTYPTSGGALPASITQTSLVGQSICIYPWLKAL